jgi:hypothetical protein
VWHNRRPNEKCACRLNRFDRCAIFKEDETTVHVLGVVTRNRQGDSDALSRVKRRGGSAESLVSSAIDRGTACYLPLHAHHAPKKEQRLHCSRRRLPQTSHKSSKRRRRRSQRRSMRPRSRCAAQMLSMHCRTSIFPSPSCSGWPRVCSRRTRRSRKMRCLPCPRAQRCL